MHWLNFNHGEGSYGFVLVPTTSSDPQLTVSDATVTEGNSGTTNATFTVTLSAAAASNVTVQYATVGGTATSGTDFTAASGTLTFTPGQTSKTVTVAVAGEAAYERDEDFFLALSSATKAVIADGVGGGTIQNDDAQPTILMNAPSSVTEGNSGSTAFVFTITLSAPSWAPVTVDYATADWGATAGTDYQAASGTLTFAPRETTKTITVLVFGDTTYEGDEWFSMTLSNPVGGTLSMGVSYVSITNDD
jgi:hypothetical protein